MSLGWLANFLAFIGTLTLASGMKILEAAQSSAAADPGRPTTMITSSPPRHTNRLSRQKSPYLLQHQHNPVDWYAWGEEAFAKARAENKPIFLSIGYSTCHWCHVMERESFENEETAAFLNSQFVSIKVDREERPDVDKIYMTFVQATTGQGGWPLNVFLTPDRKPFYGGTYFAPDNRYGRPSFMHVLKNISELWRTRHGDVTQSAQQLHDQLAKATEQQTSAGSPLTTNLLKAAADTFKAEFDPRHGGFGGAPKFPRPSQPAFLLRAGLRFQDKEAVRMVLETCEAMAKGGMHDQLGGGFHRYSVDAEWLVPHFEKMLYDNAQLVNLYLDAYLVSGRARFAEVARDTIAYVLRDMTHPEGGFYSAEDADSEGKEGKFYCWTKAELASLLDGPELAVAVRYFGVTEKGNFVDHSDPNPLPDQNVLSMAQPELAEADKPVLNSVKQKLFAARSRRVRPHLDDKILASWNGMMLGALARASVVLADDNYRAAAERNLEFLRSKVWDAKERKLYHRWRDGERDTVQLLDAYAHLLGGVIDLYEASLDPRHLQFAIHLSETMLAQFYDREHGSFFQSSHAAPDLIIRVKDDYDGAEPSGNSVAALALLKLAAITERKDLREAAEKTVRAFGDRLEQLPQAVPHLLLALDYLLEEPKRAVLAGDPAIPDTRRLLGVIHGVYQPNKVVLGTAGPVEPLARTLQPVGGKAMVYLCTGTACQAPTSDPAVIQRLLK